MCQRKTTFAMRFWVRGRLKSRDGSRASALGRMARRERRASPLRAVRSEQRRQTAQSALALRVAWLFGLGCVAPQSQTATGMLLRRALPKPLFEGRCRAAFSDLIAGPESAE